MIPTRLGRRPPGRVKMKSSDEDVGVHVESTTVWYRGESRTFTPREMAAGEADKWRDALCNPK